MTISLKSFDHMTLIVSDLEKTREFYVKILGMDEIPRPEFDFPGAWFQLGKMQIHATMTSEKAGIAGLGDLKATSLARGHHFAFEVESVKQVVLDLRRYDLTPVVGPRPRPDGVVQVYFQDPDDHVVEFFEPKIKQLLG